MLKIFLQVNISFIYQHKKQLLQELNKELNSFEEKK